MQGEDQRPPLFFAALLTLCLFFFSSAKPNRRRSFFSFFCSSFCFAMSLQATTTRNTITLKGSSKIVTEFFAYAVNR